MAKICIRSSRSVLFFVSLMSIMILNTVIPNDAAG